MSILKLNQNIYLRSEKFELNFNIFNLASNNEILHFSKLRVLMSHPQRNHLNLQKSHMGRDGY